MKDLELDVSGFYRSSRQKKLYLYLEGLKDISELVSDLSFWEKVKYKLFKDVEYVIMVSPGGTAESTYYLFKCPKHGNQVAYPAGYDMKLLCPKCIEGKV